MCWKGAPRSKTSARYEYLDALENAGPKLKEIILDRAAHDPDIELWDLKALVKKAYPEEF